MTVISDLITPVRTKVGDRSSPYRCADEWIESAIQVAHLQLQRYIYNKYLLDATPDIVRNTEYSPWYYTEAEVGVIEPQDESLYITMTAIVLVQGDLEANAWNIGSWKDFEISYSNIAAGKHVDANLNRLWGELEALITPPTKRLVTPRKQSLPGFKDNKFETKTRI